MILSQRFQIKGLHKVDGGSAEYYADTDSGSIQYRATVGVKSLLFSKMFTPDEDYKLDPKYLRSSSFKYGGYFEFGPVSIDLFSVIPNRSAQFGVTINSQVTGEGILDLSDEFISVQRLHLTGSLSGHDFSMELNKI